MTVANLPSWAPASIDPSKLQPIPGGGDLGLMGAAYGPSLTEGGLNFAPGGDTASGFYTTRGLPGGSTQSVYYNPQGQATDVHGSNPDTGSWADDLIKYGAIAASAYATGGGLLGLGGPSDPAAIEGLATGGSDASDLAAGIGGATSPSDLAAGIGGATTPSDLAAGTGNISDLTSSMPSSNLLNKDLTNALLKAGGQIFGSGGGGSAGGNSLGGMPGGGRSFATFDPGTANPLQLSQRQQAPVAPLTYNGGTSPAMLASALREMTGRNYGGGY